MQGNQLQGLARAKRPLYSELYSQPSAGFISAGYKGINLTLHRSFHVAPSSMQKRKKKTSGTYTKMRSIAYGVNAR